MRRAIIVPMRIRNQGPGMMHDMTNMMGGMGWGMGVIGLLLLILLILGIAALIKYLAG
jgi:hypothetical protein